MLVTNQNTLSFNNKKEVKIKGMKINISEVARDNGVCWATAKKIVTGNTKRKKRIFKGQSKLSNYTDLIDHKLENYRCSAQAVYDLIKEKGYEGSYSLVSKYVNKEKDKLLKAATIRVETTPGLQGQIDWKESLSLVSKSGEIFTVNIFLFILSYSKLKYVELTIDRRQPTLFRCMINCFKVLGGVPEEIWFDNMKTVVDKHDVNTNKVYFNSKFLEFSKNCMFTPIACKPYRPCTKGLAENLAKVMNRLKAYNEEFETYEDLENIVKRLNVRLNEEEKSQATGRIPMELFIENEKEYLNQVNLNQFSYDSNRQVRKVTKEAMINHDKHKYSVPVNLIGELVEIEVKDDTIHIYYNGEIVRTHKLSTNRFNYEENDLKEILKITMPRATENQIEEMAKRRLNGLDIILSREDRKNG